MRREFQAGFMNLGRGNENCAAAIGELVGDIHLLQRGDDLATVALRNVGKKHAVINGLSPKPGTRQQGNGKGDHVHRAKSLAHGQAVERLQG